jgi:RNA binding exosome subunit
MDVPFTIGNLISLISVLGTSVGVYTFISNRQTAQEIEIKNLKEQFGNLEKVIERRLEKMEQMIDRIFEKLDKK